MGAKVAKDEKLAKAEKAEKLEKAEQDEKLAKACKAAEKLAKERQALAGRAIVYAQVHTGVCVFRPRLCVLQRRMFSKADGYATFHNFTSVSQYVRDAIKFMVVQMV